MTGAELRGIAASPGAAVAPVRRARAHIGGKPVGDVAAELTRAHAALGAAATELDAVAARLRREGREPEADIVDTNAMMARDPSLETAVEAALATAGLGAPEAIVAACTAQAEILSSLDDATLATRAADVRSLGRRAARLAAGDAETIVAGEHVLVADELGPADVAELGPGVVAIALGGGGPTAHAAIVARSLGVPMVAALGEAIEALADDEQVVVDGDAGVVVRAPGHERVAAARAAAARRRAAGEQARASSALPAETLDGRRVTVLANVAGVGELEVAVAAGAEGVGLLRTELAFLAADAWPTAADHRRELAPVLSALDGRPATVRVLDFGGDKVPPFLAGRAERGVELLLGEPAALIAQMQAIVTAPAAGPIRVLVPMVRSAADLEAFRSLVGHLALGPMIETVAALGDLDALAANADYLSVGTNDLTAAVLEIDRFDAAPVAHDPRVLAAIAAVVEAAARARIPLEVCGEAASDPVTLPLLVGLGVDEVSVGASRVGAVRAWIRALDHGDCRALAARALAAPDAAAVAALAGPLARRLASVERGDQRSERVESSDGVAAAGRQS